MYIEINPQPNTTNVNGNIFTKECLDKAIVAYMNKHRERKSALASMGSDDLYATHNGTLLLSAVACLITDFICNDDKKYCVKIKPLLTDNGKLLSSIINMFGTDKLIMNLIGMFKTSPFGFVTQFDITAGNIQLK